MFTLLLFDISGGEIIVVILFALIFFGSKNIPELMKGLGKGIREFKNATGNIQREIRESAEKMQNQISNPLDAQITNPLDQHIESFEKEIRKVETDIHQSSQDNS
ncbi:MAG: twin-arginine translocase TatA/TatE family subunit [Candidatus Competibacteraceae bacterium]|nr:twin-arginine translocase TatA/TatE family subunit [Candidatus Competibacteraceae bacterium]